MPATTRSSSRLAGIARRVGAWIFSHVTAQDFDRPGLESAGVESLSSPYSQSVWVQRAIKKISGPIAAVPIEFDRQLNNATEDYSDPAFDAFWRDPFSHGLSWSDGIEAITGWLKLKGESFIVLDDTWLVALPNIKTVSRLTVVRPDSMREIVQAGKLIGWFLTDASGAQHQLLPEQVIHLKYWNPANPWRGQSELDPALVAAESDYLAGKYVANLLKSNGDAGPYVIAEGGIPTDPQQQQIVAALRQKRNRAARGDWRPVFLSGAVKIVNPEVKTPDAAFVAVRLGNRHEIFMSFGVPPSMADVKASYSIGSASDYFSLIHDTCIPAAAKIAGALSFLATRVTGIPLLAYFDWDEHPVMQAVRAERIDAATKLWDRGISWRQVNTYLRLGLQEFDGWDIAYLPFSTAPVGEPTPDKSSDFSEIPPAALTTQPAAIHEPALSRAIAALASRARPSPSDLARWRALMAKRQATVRAYESKFRRLLNIARAQVLEKLEAGGKSQSQLQRAEASPVPEAKAAASDFLFDLTAFKTALKSEMRKVSIIALKDAGDQLFAEIGKDDPWSMPPVEVADFIRNRDNRLVGVSDEVFADVRDTVQQGLDDGDSIADIADSIRAQFNDMSRARARTIAMTETAAAYGTGRHSAMGAAGVTRRRWLTSGNPNVRPTHAVAQGQVRSIAEPFDVGNSKLMFPSDPSGPPEEVINCHCVEIALVDEGEPQ